MSSTVRNVLLFVLAAIVGLWALKVVLGLALALFYTALPIVVIGGIAYLAWKAFAPPALGGGRRRILP